VTAHSICIVTPGYIASTPRVVREADALHDAGYQVSVVSTQGDLESIRAHDELVTGDKPWRWIPVRWSRNRPDEATLFYRSSLRFSFARRLPAPCWRVHGVAETAESRLYLTLARVAAREASDLYIGHYPGGLAAAARAAFGRGALIGYDAEDLHTEEQPDTAAGRATRARVEFIERKYLRRCAHRTAASPGIAAGLARRYGLPSPVVIFNAYPFSDRDRCDGVVKDRAGNRLSLYWFSQTIGPDRGLQDAVRAVGLLGDGVELHVRGTIAADFRRDLERYAAECGARPRVYLHDPVPPGELLSRALEHDVGLALEQPVTQNKALAASNKLFLYFLAGLAVAASDVPGQRTILNESEGAGFLYPPGDASALARGLDAWRANAAALRDAKRAALDAARARWNWEIESRKLTAAVSMALGRSPAVGASA
jgi:glycosyltransferase involved in cell wall biosynthesis